MRIAVCLKQISFVYARTGLCPDKNFVAAHDIVRLNNPLDEVALERAVQLKDAVGDEVWLLSAGPEFFEKEARRALAIGGDKLVRLYDPEWSIMDARTTALVLSRAVRKISADLVLCGARSLDLAQGQVGCYLASKLDYPYLSSTVRLNLSPNSKAMLVRRSLGRGRSQELECTLPAVVGVERNLCEPRYPSQRDILKAADKEIITWNGEDLSLERADLIPSVRIDRVTEPKPRPKWIPVPDSELPAVERIRLLLSRDEAKKDGALLEAEPGDLARSMIQFLKDKGLL
ncbi:MAG: hypothetical protein WBG50_16600 [Desulfomonilaceae bacterium]